MCTRTSRMWNLWQKNYENFNSSYTSTGDSADDQELILTSSEVFWGKSVVRNKRKAAWVAETAGWAPSEVLSATYSEWLSVHSAVSVVCGTLKALRDVLQHMAAFDKAKGPLTAVQQFNVVWPCHMQKKCTYACRPSLKTASKRALKITISLIFLFSWGVGQTGHLLNPLDACVV